jgi:hypothetical protein
LALCRKTSLEFAAKNRSNLKQRAGAASKNVLNPQTGGILAYTCKMRANTVFDVIHAKSVPYEALLLFFSFQEAEDFADPGQYFPK